MAIDIYQSRATYNEKVKWWSRDIRNRNEYDEIIMKKTPTGIFWAKETTPLRNDSQTIMGSIRVDQQTITIKTTDNLTEMKENDLVLFRGKKWIVLSIQMSKSKNQHTVFGTDKYCSHYWYLELHR